MPGQWTGIDAGAIPATFAADTTLKGGVYTISSDNPVSAVISYLTGQDTFVLGSDPWYLAGRFAVSPRGDGGSLCRQTFGFGDDADNRIEVGYCQPTGSATKWVARIADGPTGADEQFLVSTVDLDDNFHDFELWYDGVNLSFSVDGEAPVVAAPTNLPTAALFDRVFHDRGALDGGAATNWIDKFLVLTGLPVAPLPP